jgi:glycosyltransferase involved in cell wall biosynthesis
MGIPTEALVAMYSAANVLLAPSYGEGFGLTVLEAGAAGCPQIVTDFTAQPELVSSDGWAVPGALWWDAPQASWWMIPNVGAITAALEESYARGPGRSQVAIDHAAQWDADKVYAEHWRPIIEALT